ncbi:Dehydrogenase/reductase SDR family protein 7-like [Pseudolycoriella hygida]|uniref:Dehydrogenase/reductase SDR family protein 7-like n=1 Tax=Pseudolycoriella hygida TaxID=35572 RepID=A0A9Q0N1B7_9DIPT|nr:Dehydrogenase/reductase SDR family protein 7-like [Pseudolycoriella hygida]
MMKPQTDVAKSSNFFWWIFGSVSLALTLPYTIFSLIWQFKQSKLKNELAGKVVIITGASSGLGEALAHTFYMAGCKVILCARRQEELERVRKDLLECHSCVPTHPPVVLPLDLSDLNAIPEKIQKILEIHDHVDILINNGGISVRSDIVSSSVDIDIKVMLVNYFGSVAMTKHVLPSMIKRKEGQIVFVSSVQGKFAIPNRSAYAASKHAMQAFSDSLRAEVHKDNVKVLIVSPSYINTALSLNALTSTGRAHGMTDSETASGMSPEKASEDILKAVLMQQKDVIIAPLFIRFVAKLRHLFPEIYFWAMQKRAKKLAIKMELDEANKKD